ncbi:hypothetical protein BH11CYA1_BH11CYA1_17790 [soil metagenome]
MILPLFLIGCFLIVLFQAFGADQPSDPRRHASLFVKHIQENDFAKVVEGFGGNVCRCPAKLGWVSYLIYGSGEEPNLACLMGHSFETAAPEVKAMKSDTKNYSMLDKPEDYQVTIPLTFNSYRPLFLPLDMAYGYDMTAEQFEKFLADPDADSWKGLTLRMRPSLKTGTVDQPEASKNLVNRQRAEQERAELKRSNQTKRPDQSALEAELLGEAARYNMPKDAGAVKQLDGTTLSKEAVVARLPRLKSARLRLHMVRRDPRQPFTVFHFVISDPVLCFDVNGKGSENSAKDIVLKNFRPPAPTAAVSE